MVLLMFSFCYFIFAACYSIIDANNRVSLPIVSLTQTANNKRTFFSNQNDTFSTTNVLKSGEKESKKKNKNLNENPLDSFFPFDPYLLKRSKLFIESIYQEFNDVIDDEMDLDSEETDEDDEEEDDESDDVCIMISLIAKLYVFHFYLSNYLKLWDKNNE